MTPRVEDERRETKCAEEVRDCKISSVNCCALGNKVTKLHRAGRWLLSPLLHCPQSLSRTWLSGTLRNRSFHTNPQALKIVKARVLHGAGDRTGEEGHGCLARSLEGMGLVSS